MARRLAFEEWKRTAYLSRVCELLYQHLEAAPMVFKIKEVLLAWRKYTYLKRNQSHFIDHFAQRRAQA